MTPAARARRSEYRRRHYVVGPTYRENFVRPVTVPDDVVRLDTHAPCFKCGTRGACRHRPWVGV